MTKLTSYMIMLGLGLLTIGLSFIIGLIPFTSAQDTPGITISEGNSSFTPLTNTDANQVRVNIQYSVEDESLQGQVINAVMAVFAPNGTLLKTTSFPSGFTAQSDGGTETLRTSFRDKSLTSVTANVTLTDVTKSRSISNVLTINLDLEETPTVGSLLGVRPSIQN
ncbi:MAG TPA: hypothetical protein VJ599_03415 [Nitrososphaeraceae archaeon]|nr:hypothetical protein [Nitrososphaeraceae archaeon]